MNHVELIDETGSCAEVAGVLEVFALKILEKLEIGNWQLGLVLTDNRGIREYNRKWRDKDGPTDVLSFVQDDGESIPSFPGVPKEAGDIIVSLEMVKENADSWGKPWDEELRRVVIHGILHLNGMDHPEDDYSSGMLKLQEELLAETEILMKDGE